MNYRRISKIRKLLSQRKEQYTVNRGTKDRLFRFIFANDREALLQLYNALNDTSYTDVSQLEIVTLDNVVYMSMKNDLAFIIAGVLNLYEHQSSYNPNMPVRFLIYLGQEYQTIINANGDDIYGTGQISLPTPRCIVFYNGSRNEPEEKILRLSDAYEMKEKEPQVELTVRMININFGHNRELMEKCHKLWEYSYFVDQINQRLASGIGLNAAVNRAVEYCIEKDVLREILMQNKAEVVGMLLTEFNERKYKKYLKRVGFEQGRAEGHAVGLEEGRAEGRAEGRTEGRTEGQDLLAQLYLKLKNAGRIEDFEKALADKGYLRELLEEFSDGE